MSERLTRQELIAKLRISESTFRRFGNEVPSTRVGARKRVYDLAEVEAWLRARDAACQSGKTKKVAFTSLSSETAEEFTAACRRVHLRAMPS